MTFHSFVKLAAASALLLASCSQGEGVPQVSFDAQVWRAGISDRATMLGDLRANVLRPGATEGGVTALLSVPDRTLTGDEVPRDAEGTAKMLRYRLDAEQMSDTLDAAEFVVHLSASGIATGTSVFTN